MLPSPLYSGAAAIHMAALTANPALGRDYYDKLAQNGAVALRGNGAVLNAVAGGQKMYGIIVEFMALNAKAKGSPVDFVFPAEGVSIVTEPTAILRGTKNPEAARAFVDFLLSKDGQELAVSQGYFPGAEGREAPGRLSRRGGAEDPPGRHRRTPVDGRTQQEAVCRIVRRLTRSVAMPLIPCPAWRATDVRHAARPCRPARRRADRPPRAGSAGAARDVRHRASSRRVLESPGRVARGPQHARRLARRSRARRGARRARSRCSSR